MRSSHRQVVAGLALLQIGEAVASRQAQSSAAVRLDHLGFPEALRPVLPLIKVSTSVGLVAGLRSPRIGAVTSAALVSFYAAAAGFHRLAGDRPLVALPALACAAAAARCLVCYFLPVIEGRRPTSALATPDRGPTS